MNVAVTLFGFGDERPAAFGAGNQLELALSQQTSVAMALSRSGITEPESLSAILNGTMLPRADWDTTYLAGGDELKLLMAIEGG